jgi:hypothetical protein
MTAATARTLAQELPMLGQPALARVAGLEVARSQARSLARSRNRERAGA